MIAEWELLACAQAVVRQHGDGAKQHAAERIASLRADHDDTGAAVWTAIRARIDELVVRSPSSEAIH